MQFGLLPKDLAGDGQIAINVLSDSDDFAPGTRVDPSDVVANWGDATYQHDLPIFNIGIGGNDTGAVYQRNDSNLRARLPQALPETSRNRLLITAAVIGLGGAIAAFALRRRK